MASQEHQTTPSVYGPGSHTDKTFTPVPKDTQRIFKILASQTPGFTTDESVLSKVHFEGDDFPVLPGPIKAVSVAAALHAMTGVVANEILAERGLPESQSITVNTTHTAFWIATVGFGYVGGQDLISVVREKKTNSIVPDFEQGWYDKPLKYRATAIYPTKNPEVWYQIHGSLAAVPMLKSMGIDTEAPCKNNDEAWNLIASYTRTKSPEELEMHNVYHGYCGSICFSPEQWNNSEMGKALAAHPFVDVRPQPQAAPTPRIAFPPVSPTDKRPLAGVKVVEMTRIIAGPTVGNILSSYGADVIRINASHLIDINIMQLTLNAGKRTIELDIRKPADLAHLKSLLKDADIFIQGFRINKLPKYGLGLSDFLIMAAERQRGYVYVSENCYGTDGPYAERPGWQQIADSASGAAYVQGHALGLPEDECVLPSLPISDMTTGLVGALGAMMALRDRARHGGSYHVHSSLVTVNTYALKPEIGLYSPEVVKQCQERFAWAPMRSAHHVFELLFTVWDGWKRVFGKQLEESSPLFKSFETSVFAGQKLTILKPVVALDATAKESQPEWRTASVPYCFEKKEDVKWLS
ncbi:putative caib baif family enzyme protein [Coleophoma crateriformis]|uniref:Putative caib baif family enzyme protein n=1 Tax=Coleophoma crateriformis TaxID=565419 RepID=A0A3D8S3L0_9HELO|nr:putative caib baif family enzyme protein [Coleophoma crateriformis]